MDTHDRRARLIVEGKGHLTDESQPIGSRQREGLATGRQYRIGRDGLVDDIHHLGPRVPRARQHGVCQWRLSSAPFGSSALHATT